MLHSVVNNSCGFHPQWKVVALIFSAARLPRLLEEICWHFAAGLPAFSSLPFFSNSDPNLSAKLAPFSDPRQGPEKGSLSFFSRQCPNWGRVWGPNMGSRFGTQFWGPNLGPPSHAFLVAGLRATGLQLVQILVAKRRLRRLWPRHLPHGSIKQIKYLLNRVLRRQLSSCNRRGPKRRSQKSLVFSDPKKWGRSFN